MDKIINILFRVALIILGIGFFLFLLFIFFIIFIFWGIRMLWWKITGRQPQRMQNFGFNPKSGFTYFYTRATSREQHENPSRSDQRQLKDVTDVEIKEIKHPNSESGGSKE